MSDVTPARPAPAADLPYAIPTLMRIARGAYAQAIRAELRAMGAPELPRNAAMVLAGVEETGGPRADLAVEAGVTRQALAQVVDVLVGAGYLERGGAPGDGAAVLTLTGPGREVLAAVVRAVEAVDRQVEAALSPEKLQAAREVLTVLAGIKVERRESGTRSRRRDRQLRSASPIFPVASLAPALDHYEGLGFSTFAYEGGADYGFAERDGVGLHFISTPEEPRGRGMAYLYVGDADALFDQWSRAGVGGTTHPVQATDYGLREGRHVDPDGNVLRFGSPVED